MDIPTWMCDVCKKEFREGDCSSKNRRGIDIEIDLGLFEGNSNYKYNDVCYDCRTAINQAIQDRINLHLYY